MAGLPGIFDRYFWAAPSGFDLSLFESEALLPKRTGLIAADQYDAETLRSASTEALAVARRKAETLRLARRAPRRLMALAEPDVIRAIANLVTAGCTNYLKFESEKRRVGEKG